MNPLPTSTSLLDWLLSLLRDPDARAAFQADPQGYLDTCGFHDVSNADVHEALTLISDDDHRGGGGHHTHYPPPHHYSSHESPAHYLQQYVTNNYTTIEEHNTNIDNSVHQNIDTHGGDFNQVIDNDPVVASGDGAVAAGGNIDHSTVTTGDGNVVGDGNHAVTGDGNTTAFGSGSATDANINHASFGDGSAVSLGGDASGHSTDNDTNTHVHNSGSGDTSVTAAGSHGSAGQYADQSEHDNSTHSNYEDSSHETSHNTYDSNNNEHFS
ncbi:MAG TPA: IniB N-terminal domain-containing protein, partial [Pseudonocardia sp.]